MAFLYEFPAVHFYGGAGLIILSVGLLVYLENRG